MQTSVQTIVDAREISILREAWDALAARRAGYSQCQTPVYVALAIERALTQGARVLLITTRNNAELAGLWALALRREGVFLVLRPVSCGSNAEYSVPLVAPEVEAEALGAILAAARGLPYDTLYVMNVRPESALARLLERAPCGSLPKRRLSSLMCYEVGLTKFASWEDYAAKATKKHFKDRQRLMRRLTEQGEVELGWCKTPADAEAVLRWLFDTKARWARERRIETAWLKNQAVLDFFIELSRRVDLASTPLVAYVKLSGQPIAASANLLGGSSLEYFITAYDDNYARFSPGEQLIEGLLKWCIENHKEFDLRTLAADYKERLADRKELVSTYEIYLSRKARLLSGPLHRLKYLVNRSRRGVGKGLALLRQFRRRTVSRRVQAN